MFKKLLITMMLVTFGISMYAVTGETPVSGSAYYIYNVGQQKYLTVSGSNVSLTASGTQFTVGEATTSGYYTLTANGVQLTSTFPYVVTCSSDGYYTDWKFSLLSDTDNTYALSILEDEDAYSFSYLFYSNALENVANASVMPSFTDGQWVFTTSTTPEEITYTVGTVESPSVDYSETSAIIHYTIIPSSGSTINCSHVVTFEANESTEEKIIEGSFTDETYNLVVSYKITQAANTSGLLTSLTLLQSSADYTKPDNLAEYVTVKFDRTSMIVNKRSTFCVPFDMSYSQVASIFGKNVRIYEYSRNVGTRLYYKAVGSIKAGYPYVIMPTIVRDGDYYVVEDVESSTFVDAPIPVADGSFTFYGTFVKMTPAPTNIYTYNNGTFYHYDAATSISGFRAYFKSPDSNAKVVDEFFEDEVDGITEVAEMPSEKFNVYTVNGKMVKTNVTSLEGLSRGVYVVDGKKVVIK